MAMARSLLKLMAAVAMMMSVVMATRRESVFLMEILKVEETDRKQVAAPDINLPDLPAVNLPNLPNLVDSLPELSSLYSAVVSASLGEALSAKGPFTLFAPTNIAFAMATWIHAKNTTAVRDVLLYHVLMGKVLSSNIQDELVVKTLLPGKTIRFNIYASGVYTAQCAPINLDKVNVMASNGVLHELNAVMIPPFGNIVQAAVHLKETFSTLITALQTAGLVDTLSGDGNFTVFAPTNAAFAKLPSGILPALLKNKTQLTDVLLYHVAGRTFCPVGLQSSAPLKIMMLNKQEVNISNEGGVLKVNTFPVLPSGVEGGVTNGVIHVIEDVLIPPSLASLL